ncbi:MAG: hypothetical protein LIP00_07300, partial [Parabacteroides sp.]|nr:hypothetical protein [Parabacteroides sp.]
KEMKTHRGNGRSRLPGEERTSCFFSIKEIFVMYYGVKQKKKTVGRRLAASEKATSQANGPSQKNIFFPFVSFEKETKTVGRRPRGERKKAGIPPHPE